MIAPQNILVVLPSWVGDLVMATPALRALRSQFPSARISYLMRRNLRELCRGMPWANRFLTYRHKENSVFKLARRVRSGKFDCAILFPNSFKTALICRLAGIHKIVGYDRDGRRYLLTDRLTPANRVHGKYHPSPIIPYYARLAEKLGAIVQDRTMQLFVTESECHRADRIFNQAGIDMNRPIIFLNPGAQSSPAKIWPIERYAALSDRFVERLGATVLVNTAPRERAIADEFATHSRRPYIELAKFDPGLGALKEIVRRSDLMVTNDTGPRHIAAAMGIGVVSLFGPTHPEWTSTHYAREKIVQIKVDCGPCQLKACPLDHRCMTGIDVDTVWDQSLDLLKGDRSRLAVI